MLSSHPKARLVVYILSLAAAVIAPFVAIGAPEYGAAAVTASSILAAAAGITAASNVPTAHTEGE